jgi:hypothetical protein
MAEVAAAFAAFLSLLCCGEKIKFYYFTILYTQTSCPWQLKGCKLLPATMAIFIILLASIKLFIVP